jgi:hypothetical protein
MVTRVDFIADLDAHPYTIGLEQSASTTPMATASPLLTSFENWWYDPAFLPVDFPIGL